VKQRPGPGSCNPIRTPGFDLGFGPPSTAPREPEGTRKVGPVPDPAVDRRRRNAQDLTDARDVDQALAFQIICHRSAPNSCRSFLGGLSWLVWERRLEIRASNGGNRFNTLKKLLFMLMEG
jgi:hypothetical protein